MKWLIGIAGLVILLGSNLHAASSKAAPSFHELELADGKTLRYALILPEDFDPEQSWPVLLALPPGGQDERMVRFGLQLYWGEMAAERGWIVVSPAAPEPGYFSEGQGLDTLLENIEREYVLEGDRFYLAGVSMGGLHIFHLAQRFPEKFHAILGLPGFPRGEAFDHLAQLVDRPIRFLVGGEDQDWLAGAQKATEKLKKLGGDVELKVFPGEGHTPESLGNGRFMDELERVRQRLNEKKATEGS